MTEQSGRQSSAAMAHDAHDRASAGAGPYARAAVLLAGTPFASLRYLVRTGSTNEDAAALLGDPAASGLTTVAEEQTRGSGRKGRAWIAPPASALLFTTILPDAVAAADLWCVPFWVALAVRDALAAYDIGVDLHWPNDLLLGERKLCGILCTSRVSGKRAWVGCGVGINVFRSPDADASIEPAPAFCDDVAAVDRAELLASVLLRFNASRDLLRSPQRVARQWEREAGLPGKRYRLLRDGDAAPFEALAIALADGGALVVERGGRREEIALADARALR